MANLLTDFTKKLNSPETVNQSAVRAKQQGRFLGIDRYGGFINVGSHPRWKYP